MKSIKTFLGVRALAALRVSALGVAMLCSALTASGSPPADDGWPQFLGPERSGATAAAPDTGDPHHVELRPLWRRPIGSGYSAVSVVGDRGYTLETDGEDDYALAFDLADGREIWRTSLGPFRKGHTGSEDGPISTPSVAGDQVFVLSGKGRLVVLGRERGEVQWSHDLVEELGAPPPFYGFATSPLVEGERVVVQVGGKESHLVAFDRARGEVAWRVSAEVAVQYASPIATTLGAERQIVVAGENGAYGVRAEDGAKRWEIAYDLVWVHSPVALPEDRIFLASWENGLMLRISRSPAAEGAGPDGETPFRAELLWSTAKPMHTFSPAVFHEGYLYAYKKNYLQCLEPAAGEVVWQEKIYEGSLIRVGDLLIAQGNRTGLLHAIVATPQGFDERARLSVFQPGAPSMTGPSYARGRIFLRNVEELVVVDLVVAPATPEAPPAEAPSAVEQAPEKPPTEQPGAPARNPHTPEAP